MTLGMMIKKSHNKHPAMAGGRDNAMPNPARRLKVRMNFDLPHDLVLKVIEEAEKQGKSKTEIVTMAVEAWFSQRADTEEAKKWLDQHPNKR